MKIAIFHNFMDNIGGAEIVVLTLARELHADIYTTNFDPAKIKIMGFADVIPRVTSIGKVPLNAPLRQQLALYYFRKLDLKQKYAYYIIAGDWAISGAVNNKPNLWYSHSPVRELFDLYPHIRKTFLKNVISRWNYDLWVYYNRFLYRRYVKHAEQIACNSKNVQGRIKKFLKRDAIVINPPIETKKYSHGKSKGYYLAVNRLYYHKRIDMQLDAFRQLKDERLIIVGCYEKAAHFEAYAKHIIGSKPKNVKILGWVSDKKIKELYAHCKGFITTAQDEDFGMTPVEAMASGKPVIAANEGGYKETVINGKTGILIDDIDDEKLVAAIKKMNAQLEKNPYTYRDACMRRAKEFDTKVFMKKIRDILK